MRSTAWSMARAAGSAPATGSPTTSSRTATSACSSTADRSRGGSRRSSSATGRRNMRRRSIAGATTLRRAFLSEVKDDLPDAHAARGADPSDGVDGDEAGGVQDGRRGEGQVRRGAGAGHRSGGAPPRAIELCALASLARRATHRLLPLDGGPEQSAARGAVTADRDRRPRLPTACTWSRSRLSRSRSRIAVEVVEVEVENRGRGRGRGRRRGATTQDIWVVKRVLN